MRGYQDLSVDPATEHISISEDELEERFVRALASAAERHQSLTGAVAFHARASNSTPPSSPVADAGGAFTTWDGVVAFPQTVPSQERNRQMLNVSLP